MVSSIAVMKLPSTGVGGIETEGNLNSRGEERKYLNENCISNAQAERMHELSKDQAYLSKDKFLSALLSTVCN